MKGPKREVLLLSRKILFHFKVDLLNAGIEFAM